jgi:phospholipid/cholesterol/gamma-HCH transport system substrate-binding protein
VITPRRATVAALLVAVVGVVATVLLASGGDDDRYRFQVHLPNALGLRSGSLVTLGGVEIGDVEVRLDERDRVVVEGRLHEGQPPLREDTKLAITSVNLLGQKRLEVVPGSSPRTLPSGSRIPADRVTPSTDLDQVLAVLTPDVRTRLSILLNEAGRLVLGRGTDLRDLVGGLPGTLAETTDLLNRLVGSNRTLERLVARSDRLVKTLADERQALTRLVDSAGRAAGAAAGRRRELEATLAQAPRTLAAAQRFLGELQQATGPLGPAARELTRAAPRLHATLRQLEPFERAARPALAEATSAAPQLTRLADGARPVLERARPTLKDVSALADELVPVTDTLDKSADNLIAVVDNWSRAVQYRDGLSHIFRGEPTVTLQTVEGLLKRYTQMKAKDPELDRGEQRAERETRTAVPGADRPAEDDPADDGHGSGPARPRSVLDELGERLRPLSDLLTGVTDGLLGEVGGESSDPQRPADPITRLLEFLIKP